MDLKIKDVAELLNVSETTIRRWLLEGKIPAYRLNHQYRFNRNEIEDWVMSHKLGQVRDEDSDDIQQNLVDEKTGFKAVKPGVHQYNLYRALHKGGIHTQVPGDTKEQVIRSATEILAERFDLDAEVLTDLLLDRERLMPTSLNNGIGVPHTRDFLLKMPFDIVAAVFPQKPIEYGALDGKPVHTLFFLFACEDKRHLHLLAKLAHLSSQPQAIEMLRSRPNKTKLLESVKNWEGSVALAEGKLQKR
ncbi:MAG: PTS sugar transporter subunit IIA [Parachlamydiales bacterium]|nr:PTS sugar transporter subunit IIA [Parachlamydiales bacterium]